MRLHLNFNTGKSLLGKLGSEAAQPLISLPGWCDCDGSLPGAHPGIPRPQPQPTDWCPCCPALLPQQGAQLVCLSARFCPSGGLAGAFIGWSAYSLKKKKKKEILWGKSCLWVSAAFGDLLSEMHLITSAMAASHLASVPHETQSSFYGGCRHAQGLAASPSKAMDWGCMRQWDTTCPGSLSWWQC